MSPLDSATAPDYRRDDSDPPEIALPFQLTLRFKLVKKIGEGGFGLVFEAEDHAFPLDGGGFKLVAVKIIFHSRVPPWVLKRLRIAEMSVGFLQHPNIASAFDAGEASIPYRGQRWDVTYIALELLDERMNILGLTADLSMKERINALIEVAEGLEHAQRARFRHRHLDIKPGNILAERVRGGKERRRLKIVDFGLAGWGAQTPANGGTVEYASPEQLRGDPVGVRSDVYSLAVVAYEVLMGKGRLPYTGFQGPFEKLPEPQQAQIIVNGSIFASGSLQRELPKIGQLSRRRLELVIRKALENDPGQRYSGAGAFKRDLHRFLRGEMVSPERRTRWGRLVNWIERNRASAAVVVLLFATSAVVTTASAIMAWQYQHNEKLAQAALHEQKQRQEIATKKAESIERFSDFLRDFFLEFDTYRSRGRDLNFAYLVQSVEPKLNALVGEPIALASAYGTLGRVAANWSEYDRGIVWLREASRLWSVQALQAPNDVERHRYQRREAIALNHLAWALKESGNIEAAIGPAHEAFELQESLDGPQSDDVIAFRSDWARMLLLSGEPRGFQEFVATLAVVSGQTVEQLLADLAVAASRAIALAKEGNSDEAERVLRQALSPFFSKQHPRIRGRVPWSLAQTAVFISQPGNLPSLPLFPVQEDLDTLSRELARLAYKLAREISPEGHPDIAKTMRVLEVIEQRTVPASPG